MAGRLANKVCTITGASSGQGRAAAEAFARDGATLVLSDVDAEGLEETAARCRAYGVDPSLHIGDLTTEAANQELTAMATKLHGRLDAMYNVAGLVRFAPIHETTLEDWNFTIEHELTITFLGCKWAVRAMLEYGGGSIINVSSTSGMYGARRNAAHAATKTGITGLTRHVSHEYGPRGIRCNAIAPSYVEFSAGERRIASQTPVAPPTGPLGRHVRPRDTADLAAFLASDESSFISGQVIIIDGAANA